MGEDPSDAGCALNERDRTEYIYFNPNQDGEGSLWSRVEGQEYTLGRSLV